MIYFDNAATTFVSKEVQESFSLALEKLPGNASSNHVLGYEAFNMEEKAKQQIGQFFNVTSDEVIFTSGASESNNLAIKGVAFRYKNRGNHIITSATEHASVKEVFNQLHDYFGFNVTYLPVNDQGLISITDLKNAITEQTILVSIMAVNNETGAIQPIKEIGELLKSYDKIHFHCDATQAIGKIDVDYNNCSLISLSGHKINGFKQSGILIKKKNCDLLPLIAGGGQQNGFRSGTTNVPGEVALARAIRIAFTNQKEHLEYISSLNKYFIEQLKSIEGIKFNSTEQSSPFIISFSTNKKGSVIAEELSNKKICVSTKSACSSKKLSMSYVLKAMGKDDFIASNSIRISLSYENTREEIDTFINELKIILKNIKQGV